ncbi:arginase [Pleomorphomonas oryzae]|uniref:arginase n=1 Tax=Pleomorphomonas oryzae TaxID=261934 RepID=UPI00040820E9|nr:arginase [Pleomorphomonas oryzae]
MQLYLLHLDEALEAQSEFVRTCLMAGCREIDVRDPGRKFRLWARQAVVDDLHRSLRVGLGKANGEPRLCFLGSGDFHHVSSLLIDLALDEAPEPVTVIHIDNHPDWVHFSGGLHCGSWINRVADHPSVDRVITVGVCSDDLASPERKGANLGLLASGRLELYPFHHSPSRVKMRLGGGTSFEQRSGYLHWRTIGDLGFERFLELLMERIETEAVYVSLDKDVLCSCDAVTNWDQGQMKLAEVLRLLNEIGNSHRIIGADVTGDYSRPRYGGGAWTRLMKLGEGLIDQPRNAQPDAEIININSAANYALLDVFGAMMP